MNGIVQFLGSNPAGTDVNPERNNNQPSQATLQPWNVSRSYPLPVAGGHAQSQSQVISQVAPVVNIVGALFAQSATRRGARIINWLPAPIFIAPFVTPPFDPEPGPGSTALSDYVPAYNASTGVPGQYNFCFAPLNQWNYIVTGTFTAGDVFNVLTW